MSTQNIFELATRQKVRFETPKGALTVEDLWSLPLTSNVGQANLDDIAKSLHRLLKNNDEVSFVKPAVAKQSATQLKFDIVKYVIDTRITERDDQAQAAGRAEQKQKILAIVAAKRDGKLQDMSEDELLKLAESL